MCRRLAIALGIGVLVATISACDAGQGGSGSAPLPCPPAKDKAYCTHAIYAKVVNASWRWAVNHPNASDRRPVPFPAKGASPNDGKNRVVYVVWFDGNKVWKFGQTEQRPWTKRANEGKRTCEKSKEGRECWVDWMATTNKRYSNARFLEASLIKAYERDKGRCPPGQRVSCR